ncbi:hypothetical protein XENOCAPTIV_023001 [Xenoophorus captivus]|uniref:Uncharacterized protein n=1 Tax=Xenoophorus captivus TaxID=1517983 RepID=A0ABV0S2A5_9TELE
MTTHVSCFQCNASQSHSWTYFVCKLVNLQRSGGQGHLTVKKTRLLVSAVFSCSLTFAEQLKNKADKTQNPLCGSNYLAEGWSSLEAMHSMLILRCMTQVMECREDVTLPA